MWAFTGECKRNAGFMNVQCQRSCHSCKLPDEVRLLAEHTMAAAAHTSSCACFQYVLLQA